MYITHAARCAGTLLTITLSSCNKYTVMPGLAPGPVSFLLLIWC